MNKVEWALLVALIASSLLLVQSAYDARRAFAAIDRAAREQRLLDAEFERLDAERQAQATHLRVERVAREKLQMRSPTPGVTTYVDVAAASAEPAK